MLVKEGYCENEMQKLIKIQKNEILVKAEEYYLQKEYLEGEDYLKENATRQQLENDVEFLMLLGIFSMQKTNYEESMKYFGKAIKCNSKKWTVFIKDLIGITYSLQEKYDKGSLYFYEVSSEEMNNVFYHLHLVYCNQLIISRILGKNKKDEIPDNLKNEIKPNIEQIKDEFSNILKINPNHYETLVSYGQFEAFEKHDDTAMELLMKALELNPKDGKVSLFIAQLYSKNNNTYKESIEWYEKYISIIGNENVKLEILKDYMKVLSKEKDWSKMEVVCKKILLYDRSYMNAVAWLAKSYKALGKYKELHHLLRKIKKKLKDYFTKIQDNKDFKDEKKNLFDEHKRKIKNKIQEINTLILQAKLNKIKEEEEKKKEKENPTNRIDNHKTTIYRKTSNNLVSKDLKKDFDAQEKKSRATFTNLMESYFKEEDFINAENAIKTILDHKENNKELIDIAYEKYGDMYLCEKILNIDKAIKIYEKLIKYKENEKKTILYIKLGRCFEMKKEYDKALDYYTKAEGENKGYVWAYYHKGVLECKMGNPEGLHDLKRAFEKEKENVDILQKYGHELIKHGKELFKENKKDDKELKQGIEILTNASNYYIGNCDVICSLAYGLDIMNKTNESIKLLEAEINNENFNKDEYKLYQLATYYEKTGNFAKATDTFKQVLKINKNNVNAYIHLGLIFECLKEYSYAYLSFLRAEQLDKNNIEAKYGLANIYENYGKDEEAIKYLNECIKLDNNHIKFYIKLGQIYFKLKQYEKAKEYFEDGYKFDENNIDCINGLASYYQQINDYNKVEEYIRKVPQSYKNNIVYQNIHADVDLVHNKYVDALKYYEKVLSKIKDCPEIYVKIGHCYYGKKSYLEAIEMYKAALKITRNTNDENYYYLACAFAAANKYDNAIKCYLCAIKLCPKKHIYYLGLAHSYYKNKDLDKAIDIANKVTKLITDKKIDDSEKEAKRQILLKNIKEFLFKCNYNKPNLEFNFDNCYMYINELYEQDPYNTRYLKKMGDLYSKNHDEKNEIECYKRILELEPDNFYIRERLEEYRKKEEEEEEYEYIEEDEEEEDEDKNDQEDK